MSDDAPSTTLKADAVGTAGIAFFVLAFAAPLTGIIGLGPITLGEGGSPGAPGAFLLTTLILLVFSVGFAAMSREHAGPGGFAVYVGKAFGERAARGATGVAVIGYNTFLGGSVALFSASTANVLTGRYGIDLPWWVYGLTALAAIAVLGYREVKLSVRVLGVLLVAEVVIVLVLDAVVLATGGADGLDVDGFSPTAMTQGGIGIVFLMAFAAFVGFEATTLFGEEARDRQRTIPRATYLAVAIVGTFYVLSMWVLQLGWGAETATAASTDPANFLFALNTAFVGQWSTDIMQWLVLSSIFAATLSLHGSLSRYLFAMGRGGMLPAALGTTHRRMKSPHLASLTQTGVTTTLTVLMVVSGADLLSVIYPWMVGIGSVAILVLYVAASISVCVSLRRSPTETRLWVTTIAPITAAIAMGAVLVLAIVNYGFLTGTTNPVANSLWLLAPLAGLVGYAVRPRRRGVEPSAGVPHDAGAGAGAGR
ncbi:amino acid/polyamine/organocation transporter (APC superfamily) [Pseudonocardia hierapolitana]|uniref:Amino acid/polyamine/organocation transporter (APC superfamily) n=1 Tax=Pseudonocardia hierapolitana TaxID=1128676 RepID=A0A561SJE7_9PSEU|nr:APC family permease [Pseudonocardia hierapolitana]TWF75018.1 amino acid/polyamine/organocation transporter (APC superfamily) [Pseudonocardia hierapolitana]